MTYLAIAWRWRFTILIAAVIAVGGWTLLHIKNLKVERDNAEAAFKRAAQVNADLVKANERIEAAKLAGEQALASKLARKSREADQLAKLVQYVTAQEKTNACAAAPAVRSVLDELRKAGELK